MSAVPTEYEGREQTYIKHSFLTKYLRIAAYKVLQGRSPVFNYVDAFAGPWQLAAEDEYSDASFHQAVETLEEVRADLGRQGRSGLRVQSFFCERKPGAASLLREYAQEHKRLNIRVFEGAFEEHLDDIEASCRNGFTFTFIDPTGWKIQSASVFRFLERLRGEFLLNFMAEHINRHAVYSGVTTSIGRFLADPDWEEDFAKLPTTWSNERRVLHLLRTKMKQHRVATYLPDIAIKRPREDRIKMRLVLGTHSDKGVEVFRDVQEKVERSEMEIRSDLKLGAGFRTLFASHDQLIAMRQKLEGVGCPSSLQNAERSIRSSLQQSDGILFGQLAPRVMEDVPIRKTQLNTLMMELKERCVVSFDLPPRARVPRPGTRIWLV